MWAVASDPCPWLQAMARVSRNAAKSKNKGKRKGEDSGGAGGGGVWG